MSGNPDNHLEIQAREITKNYGSRQVLGPVDWRLDTRRTYLLEGPNGAGKTTLLKILAGVLGQTHGRVTWHYSGDPNTAAALTQPDPRLHTAYIGHESGLYSDWSGLRNLRFFSRFYDWPGRTTPDPERLLRRLRLWDARHKPVRFYSRGMRQRLALARGLAAQPAFFFFDEPLTGLDHQGRELLLTLLREHREAGGGALIISHSPDVFAPLCDERHQIREGRLNPGAESPA